MRALRIALRDLSRRPTFVAAVVASLALGIGANATMVALLDALLFRPIGVAEPDRLIRIAAIDDAGVDRGLTPPMIEALRASRAVDEPCAVVTPMAAVEIGGVLAPRAAHAVSGSCFAALGVHAAVGRLLTPDDDRAGAEPVAVLAHSAWIRDYGGRPTVVGERLVVDGRRTTIVGVVEARFTGVLLGFHPAVVYPMARLRERMLAGGQAAPLPAQVLARLRAGENRRGAAARLETAWPAVLDVTAPSAATPEARAEHLRRRVEVTSAATGLDFSLRRRFTSPLLALMTLSGLLLAMSCVNGANLLLARGREQARDTALRVALGASRGHVVRHALTESLLLLTAGVALGCLIAYAAARAVVVLLAGTYAGLQLDVSPDARVLLVTIALAAIVFAASAGIPAWRAGAVDPRDALGSASRTTHEGRSSAAALVTGQVALAFVLVAGGMLCARAIGELRETGGGVDPDHVVSATLIARPSDGVTRPASHTDYQHLMARIGALPSVAAVAMSSHAPLVMVTPFATVASAGPGGQARRAETVAVTEQFIGVMGLSVVAGRGIGAADTATAPRVALLSESLATAIFGTRAAIGRQVRIGQGAGATTLDVVGVVRDAVVGPTRERNVQVAYTSFWQATPGGSPTLLARVTGDADAAVVGLTREIQAVGRHYPARIRSLAADRDASLLQESLLAWSSAAFALLGLLLAAVGVYGVLAVAVARRTHEIGVRLALGAGGADVVRTVGGWALRLLGTGTAIGGPLVWLGARAMRSLLPVRGDDLVVPIVGAAVVLLAVGTAAAWAPVRRALRIRPAECLRG